MKFRFCRGILDISGQELLPLLHLKVKERCEGFFWVSNSPFWDFFGVRKFWQVFFWAVCKNDYEIWESLLEIV